MFFATELDPDPTEVSAFVDAHRERFGVEPVCRVLGVSASAFYQRASGQRSARRVADERLLARIREVHARQLRGLRVPARRGKQLLRARVSVAPRCHVQRLMRAHGIQGAKRRGQPWRTTVPDPSRSGSCRTSSSGTSPPRRRTSVGSRTSPICAAGRALVFFAFILDVYSRIIVGWQFAIAHAHLARRRRAGDGRRPRTRPRGRGWSTTPTADLNPDSTGRRNTLM